MTYSVKRPYLVIAKLIEQPTWGGEYICRLKNWAHLSFLHGKKIGQSYELYGNTKLATVITDSQAPNFLPEVGSADTSDIEEHHFPYKKNIDYIDLAQLIENQTKEVLGAISTMPLLIKMNQASGNSFQLHIKPGTHDSRWLPKPESWYYFEDGAVTFGIKKGVDINAYKMACHSINNKMKELSSQVVAKTLSADSAKKEAKKYIAEINPWQYVNQHRIKKYDLLDLSSGAIHHSWEEDTTLPYGNVLYEIQCDVMDPVCTIRSFDQGKFKSDGTIREIHIEDYFKYIDTDNAHNTIENAIKKQEGNRLLTTKYYSMDILDVPEKKKDNVGNTFCHLYVRDGEVTIEAAEGSVHLSRGHSCFLPHAVGDYLITAHNGPAVLLKSYIE